MSMTKNFEMDKSEESLPFKVFEPRSSSRFRSESLSSSSTSKLNLTVGSPVMSSYSSAPQFSSSSNHQLMSPGGEEEGEDSTRCFDFTGLRRLTPRPVPSELLLASSSPTGSMMNPDLFQSMKIGFAADPNLPKRLHVSNLPFRYREHNLVMLFGKLGNVEDAEIIYNDKGSKGFGFVTMSRGRDADNALIRLNHSIVEGRIIEVNLATPKLIGFKKAHNDLVPPGVSYSSKKVSGPPSPPLSPHCSLPGTVASAEALVEAEAKLAEAKLEVSRIRKQLKMERFRCQASAGLDMSSLRL